MLHGLRDHKPNLPTEKTETGGIKPPSKILFYIVMNSFGDLWYSTAFSKTILDRALTVPASLITFQKSSKSKMSQA
ncbi:hypothetical protein [Ruminococcus flavefaciens]|uniref:hypothetical protein n=1 Tax=Ruminococcus flavefaciens TaxID=1265 RepID=UPI001A9A55E4|nr:hypothetical protein [Ruminococcus flavefaciens]